MNRLLFPGEALRPSKGKALKKFSPKEMSLNCFIFHRKDVSVILFPLLLSSSKHQSSQIRDIGSTAF